MCQRCIRINRNDIYVFSSLYSDEKKSPQIPTNENINNEHGLIPHVSY